MSCVRCVLSPMEFRPRLLKFNYCRFVGTGIRFGFRFFFFGSGILISLCLLAFRFCGAGFGFGFSFGICMSSNVDNSELSGFILFGAGVPGSSGGIKGGISFIISSIPNIGGGTSSEFSCLIFIFLFRFFCGCFRLAPPFCFLVSCSFGIHTVPVAHYQ